MKKWLVFALLACLSTVVMAQEGTAYFSVLPGYQFDSSEAQAGWVFNLGGGYRFTDHVALYVGLMTDEGKFDVGPFWNGNYKYDDTFYIADVGAEFYTHLTDKDEIYGQVLVGYAFGLGGFTIPDPPVVVTIPDEENRAAWTATPGGGAIVDPGNEFAYGLGAGYRHFFTDKVSLNLQTTWHRVGGDWDQNFLDARIGVCWKF